jgi:hypothetical protein
VVEDISHEGLRAVLREQGVSFQRLKTWKQSRDPDYEARKNRLLHLYGLMDGTDDVEPGDPDVVICTDEFAPAQPPTPPRPPVGRPRRWRPAATTASAGHLQPPARRAALARRL